NGGSRPSPGRRKWGRPHSSAEQTAAPQSNRSVAAGRVAAIAALHYVCRKALPAQSRHRAMNPAEDGLPKPQRYWAILTLMVGLAMSCLDTAIVNVALPVIAKDLHTSAADSIWVVNAYQLAVMISLLPFASFGDIFGYRRVYRFGLVFYTTAALVSALATSLDMLTLGR